jgi:hypothetical protein
MTDGPGDVQLGTPSVTVAREAGWFTVIYDLKPTPGPGWAMHFQQAFTASVRTHARDVGVRESRIGFEVPQHQATAANMAAIRQNIVEAIVVANAAYRKEREEQERQRREIEERQRLLEQKRQDLEDMLRKLD